MAAVAVPLTAQHEHHGAEPDTMAQHDHMALGALGLPQSREGSGTSWLPDLTPMEGHHAEVAGWMLMLHYNVFLQYLWDGGERGHDQLGSINWGMGMAYRPLLGGLVGLRAMVSAEPWTVGECGYPDLLATGETCEGGRAIVDQQHPHDVFMELAGLYRRELGERVGLELYGGLAAEPALGPVAYPHRPSAMRNPVAPITHHWLDATHIAFGVVTGALFGPSWKLEGSLFNGREPDEERTDLDLAPMDSYAGRLTLVPSERWVVQVSAGHLVEAEPGHDPGDPRVDVDRYTASVIHHREVAPGRVAAATLALGRNVEHEIGTNALLLEGTVELTDRSAIFGRGEVVEKAGKDLVLAHELEETVHTVGKLSLGMSHELGGWKGVVGSLGGSASVSVVPSALEPYYGQAVIPGFGVFFRVHP